jgi:N-carbamoylputrescine amidase
MNPLKAALIQQTHTDDAAANRRRSAEAIRQAHANGAELVVLSELHITRYFCQTESPAAFDLAEPVPGPSTDVFAALARELGIVLVGSFFERRAPGLYHNTAVVFERDGTIAGRYRKMHIPDDPGYYEKFYFTPGDLGFMPVSTSVGRLGVLVCWDQWYPEAARLMALAGADLLIYPTAIGWEPSDAESEKQRQLDAWVTIQRSHAVANGLPVLSVNRVGFEPSPQGAGGIQFWGHSFAAGPQGDFLARAATDSEAVLTVEIDGRRSEAVRRIWPFLRDRRIDAYDDLAKRFRDGNAKAVDGTL